MLGVMSENKKYKTIIFSVVALLFPLVVAAQDISGWRTPTQTNLSAASAWRKEDPELYLTLNADFDGDGKTDTANLLINDKENRIGLFVTMASMKNPPVLLEATDIKEIRNMGIKTVKPGQYKTACGKGYWKCKKDEPEILKLKQPAIDFFTYEGANSYFVWDKKDKAFKKIWMSD